MGSEGEIDGKMAVAGEEEVEEEDEQQNKLVKKVTELYERIASLPSLKPSPEVNDLFGELVKTCIPPSSIDVSKLGVGAQAMRASLIRLCGEAECLLESYYAALLCSSGDNDPLDRLALFPYFGNYLKLSHLEYDLLSRHAASEPSSVAFVGSGPLPLTSIVLATWHLRSARFHNYDVDPAANSAARRLVAASPEVAGRMWFHTVDVLEAAGEELRRHDVVFLAALVGMGKEEKAAVVAHLGRNMAPGALLVLRSATGARAFLYPVVDPCCDLAGAFEVLAVHHPSDEVINSVVVARKLAPTPPSPVTAAEAPAAAVTPAAAAVVVQAPAGECCCGHGRLPSSRLEEKLIIGAPPVVTVEEQPS